MSLRNWPLAALSLTAALAIGSLASAADAKRTPRELASFGVLQSPTVDEAKNQAQTWLNSVGKTDEASQKAFAAIWASDRAMLDKVADTLCLGDVGAARLLSEARDYQGPAPTQTPAILKDLKLPAYFRSNLALAYAKTLTGRRVFEEVLEAIKVAKPEQVVDPAAYFFYKAVSEHTLMLKQEANDSIARLLDDVIDAPERYRMVGALMHLDMLTWQDKDLGWIARKMSVIKDRLEITRGGKKTQQMQKEVLVRLDEMIKELENQQKSQCQGCNGGNCPPGSPGQPGPANGNQPSSPAGESQIPSAPPGSGTVDPKRLKDLADVWGTLPEKERAKAMLELTRDMPAKYREAIEIYLKQISARSTDGR
jgi:hypothetical protein